MSSTLNSVETWTGESLGSLTKVARIVLSNCMTVLAMLSWYSSGLFCRLRRIKHFAIPGRSNIFSEIGGVRDSAHYLNISIIELQLSELISRYRYPRG